MKNKVGICLRIVIAASLAACGKGTSPSVSAFGDTNGVEELARPLTALATPPAFASNALTVTLASGELAVIAKHPVTSMITVNDQVTTGATSTAVKTIVINGAGGDETVILDFANGTFASGTTSATGITVALGAGDDIFKIRGSSAATDTITVGGTALAIDVAFNTDNYKDIAVTGSGTIAFTASLGGGNDVFNADSGTYGTGGSPFAGDVTVFGGLGDDRLTGGDGDDVLNGDAGADTLSGGSNDADSDTFNGGSESDTVTYAGRSADLVITVGAGADDGDAVGGEADDIADDVETVIGGTGDDTFTGTTGNQTFYGGAGDDTFLMGLLLTTGAGNDTVYGEAGSDTVSYADRLEAVTVTMDSNVANDGNATASELDNVRNDIENFICPTGAFVCTVTGNTLDNTITGGGGADVLSGGTGDDTFVMGDNADIGAGADSITGGAGLDTVSFEDFGATINVIMDFTASTTMGKLIATDVENLVCPTADACTVTGNAGANHFYGSSDDDTFNSAGGDDTIESNGGADTVDCGSGSDIVIGSGLTKTDCEL